jgi:Ca2+-binding RTX toxin-like protein
MPFASSSYLKPGKPYVSSFYYQWGTSGSDWLFGTEANDWIDGGAGNDGLFGFGGNDALYGGAGDDLILAGDGADSLYGGIGNDVLEGGAGNDYVDGGEGDDTILVDAVSHQDTYIGGAGIDTLSFVNFDHGVSADIPQMTYAEFGTWSGFENIIGSAFGDYLYGGFDDNRIEGSGGDDTIHGNLGNDTLLGGAGTDRLYGQDGDDILEGGDGDDWLDGGYGDDLFIVDFNGNADYQIISAEIGTYIGASGSDTISFENFTGGVEFYLDGMLTEWVDGTMGRSWYEIENVRGSYGDDLLSADDGDNVIEGLDGNDTLVGAEGSDTLIGGEGADTFAYWEEGLDTILDFTAGVDRIALSPSYFGLTSLDEVDFFAGTDVHAADRAALLYNPETAVVSFDLDGEFGMDPIMLATLSGAPEISKADFVIGG